MSTGLGLRRIPGDPGPIEALAARFPRITPEQLLARRTRRATPHRPTVPHGTRGLRWRWDDQASQRWWPQGVDVQRRPDGRLLGVVSWFAQRRRGATRGVRLTFVDLDADRPRYRHVLLVAPVRSGGRIRVDPVPVHAGGVAWSGDRILVAATHGGLREFRLGDLLDASGGWSDGWRGRGPHGADALLPQRAELRATTADGAERLRYSFVSLESAERSPALVVGEYTGGRGSRRLVRIPVADGEPAWVREACEIGEVHDPGILRMQGALVVDGAWHVSSSNGDRVPGDLWMGGSPDELVRLRHALEPGPEDLAVSRDTAELWSVTEFPWQRTMVGLDLRELRAAADELGDDAERPLPPERRR